MNEHAFELALHDRRQPAPGPRVPVRRAPCLRTSTELEDELKQSKAKEQYWQSSYIIALQSASYWKIKYMDILSRDRIADSQGPRIADMV